MRKKLWTALLALALCAAVLCVGAGAADETEGEAADDGCIAHGTADDYSYIWHLQTMEEAADLMYKGSWSTDYYKDCRIEFLENVIVSETFRVSRCNTRITLDLNGHTISGALADSPVVEVDYVYGNPNYMCVALRNGVIQNTAKNGIALQLTDGAATLEHVDVTGDMVLAHEFAESRNYTPTFLGGGSFTKIRAADEAYQWSRSLKSMLGEGCYFIGGGGGRLDADTVFGTHDTTDTAELVDVQVGACDHRDADGHYTLFEDTQTSQGGPAKRCRVCGNLCSHMEITDGPDPICKACGLPIVASAESWANKVHYGPYHYAGFDDAAYHIQDVVKGIHMTITLLADAASNGCEWSKNTDDGLTIRFQGHTLTLNEGRTVKVSGKPILLGGAGGTAELVGTVVVNEDKPSQPCLSIPEDSGIRVGTLEVGAYGNAELAGGSFGTVRVAESKKLASLLVSGYCFTDSGTGEPVQLYDTEGSAKTELTNVTVAKCGHNAVFHNPKTGLYTCPCGQVTFAASVTKDGATAYYADMQNAFDAAEGGTVKLVAPWFPNKTVTVPADVTAVLDLSESGYYWYDGEERLQIFGNLTVVSGGSVDWVNSTTTVDADTKFEIPVTVEKGGVLTVPAAYTGGGANRLRLEGDITVESGGSVQLDGGVCGYITASGSLVLISPGDVTVSGGSFQRVTIYETYFDKTGQLEPVWPHDVTYADFEALLTGGKSFRLASGERWANGGDVEPSSGGGARYKTINIPVTVAEAPIADFTAALQISGTDRGTAAVVGYGGMTSPYDCVRASVHHKNGAAPASQSFQWYMAKDGGDAAAVSGPQSQNLYFNDHSETKAANLGAGTYTFYCEGTFNGYVRRSNAVTVTVEPKKLLGQPILSNGTDTKTYDGTTASIIRLAGFYTDADAAGMVILTQGRDFTLDGAAYESAAAGKHEIELSVTLVNPNYTFADGRTQTWRIPGAITKAALGEPMASGRAMTILNRYQKTYTFDLTAFLPALEGERIYGETAYTLAAVELPGYETDKPSITGSTLILPVGYADKSAGRAGEVRVRVSSTNYEDFTLTIPVNAEDKTVPTGAPTPSRTTLTYGERLSAITLSGVMKDGEAVVAGSFRWARDAETLLHAGTHTVGWVFCPADGDTYAEVEGSITVTVSRAVPAGAPKYTAITAAGKTLADAGLTTEGGTFSIPGTVKWVDAGGAELAPETEVEVNTAYRWVFTPADTANYTEASGSVTLYRRSSGGGSSRPAYAVSTAVADHGTVTVSPKNAAKGDTVTVTVKPDSGYALETVTVADQNGDPLKLTDKGAGRYTFTMPGGRVEVRAVFAKAQMAPAFGDVPAGSYYADAVAWAAEYGITGGIGGGLFAPGQPCTRGQIVTFLWRAAGSPAPKGTAAVPADVLPGSYCTDAVAWALENGIAAGFADGAFRPDATCTRAQAVTFLFRAAAGDAVTLQELVSGYDDAGDVPGYALSAMNWALSGGVVQGSGGSLLPHHPCTRAQIVTFLYRAYQG